VAGLTTPVGVLVSDALVARYLAQICRELSLRVPLDVGIVTQYNTDMVCMGFAPTLSSVDHDYEQVGRLAAQLLDRLMTPRRRPPKP